MFPSCCIQRSSQIAFVQWWILRRVHSSRFCYQWNPWDYKKFDHRKRKVIWKSCLRIPIKFYCFKRPKEIPVFNVTCHPDNKKTWGYVLEEGRKLNEQYPMEAGLWYPNGDITTNALVHKINVALFHWGPAYLIDVSKLSKNSYHFISFNIVKQGLMFCFGQKRL